MREWWDHLLHTPMIDLAWHDQLAALGLIAGLFAATFGLFTLVRPRRRR